MHERTLTACDVVRLHGKEDVMIISDHSVYRGAK